MTNRNTLFKNWLGKMWFCFHLQICICLKQTTAKGYLLLITYLLLINRKDKYTSSENLKQERFRMSLKPVFNYMIYGI